MVRDTATIDYLCALCPKFAKPRQLVRVEVSEVSNLNL
jgi:hypothetical protein